MDLTVESVELSEGGASDNNEVFHGLSSGVVKASQTHRPALSFRSHGPAISIKDEGISLS